VEPAEVQLTLTNDPSAEPGATDDAQLGANRLTHAIIVLGTIVFRSCDTSDDDVTLDGPFVVDLAQNRIEPSLPLVTVTEAGVCGIDATLAPATEPSALAGRSIFFSGTRSDDTLFLLFADMPGTLRLRPRIGLAWSTDHDWLWALRPRRWLSPAELDASEPEETAGQGRVIVINANRHPLLYGAIRARLGGRSTLHLDLNDNLELDDSERTGDAFLGLGSDNLD
jgi:hypothetical protein